MKIENIYPDGRKFAMEIDPRVILSFLGLLMAALRVLMMVLGFLAN